MKAVAVRTSERLLQHLVARQFAVRDRFVNSGQVLINNPPGTQVKMSNFRIAHLPIRQTDIGSAGAQFTAWIIPVERVVNGVRARSVASPFSSRFSRPPGLMPQPSRMMSMTGSGI